jgi:hypothetical protein
MKHCEENCISCDCVDNYNNESKIDDIINILERDLIEAGHVPGTSLTRTLPGGNNARGFAWCLSLGAMHEPKRFFEGVTIEECLNKALQAINVER